jgi:hypothetical protein
VSILITKCSIVAFVTKVANSYMVGTMVAMIINVTTDFLVAMVSLVTEYEDVSWLPLLTMVIRLLWLCECLRIVAL